MKRPTRSVPLLISIVLLCTFGLSHLLSLHSIMVSSEPYGEFTSAVKIGNVIGAVIATPLYFGLAYMQWKKRGTWGLGIGLFAIVILLVQSGLMYLALGSGRVPPSTLVLGKFVVFSVIGAGSLAACSFVSYAAAQPRATDPST